MLVDKASLQYFAMVSSLTATASPSPAAAEDPAALPTVTGPKSPVNSHRSSVTGQRAAAMAATPVALSAAPSSPPAAVARAALPTVTGPQSPVHSHRSSVTGQRAAALAASLTALSADSVEKLLANFPDVVNSSKTLPRRPSKDFFKFKDGVFHYIRTQFPPPPSL
jgi:hypothetical protein